MTEMHDSKLINKITKILTRFNSVIRTGVRSGRVRVELSSSTEGGLEVTLLCESSLLANLIANSCNLEELNSQLNEISDIKIFKTVVRESSPEENVEKKLLAFESKTQQSHWDTKSTVRIFDEFIKLPENQFAFEAVNNLLATGTPAGVLIFGPSGNGKSHMCQLVADVAKQRGLNLFQIHSTAFVSWFVHSAYKNSLETLRREVLESDLFILEDIQELSGKEKTQKELGYLFEMYFARGKMVICTADRNLIVDSALTPSFKGKLAAFLPCEIKPPKKESRLVFLQKKLGGFLSKQIIEFVAEHFCGSVRQLETFVKNVQIYKSLSPKNGLGLDEIKKILKRFIEFDSSPAFNLSKLVEALASIYKVQPDVLLSNSKRREAVKARAILVVVLKDHFKLNFSQISKLIGMKDHSASLKIYTRVKQEAPQEVEVGVSKCIEIYSAAH